MMAALLTLVSGAWAQQTGKVTRTFFPDPDVEMDTPAFHKKHGYTTYSELMDYLHGLITAHPGLMKLEIVGRTQKGREIPMIHVSRPGQCNDKLRVMYTGLVHGNEPAAAEGLLHFLRQLAENDSVNRLLDRLDFYILPMVNIDGAEENRRVTADGTDLNRNLTLLTTPEAQTLQRVAGTVRPHVFVDFHEYKPLRASYEDVSDRLVTNPNDFMFLWSSHPNVASELTEAVTGLFVPEAEKMAVAAGLRNSTYFTTKSDRGDVVFNVGGSSPRSTSNSMALRGAVSMLMEIRGIGLGRTSFKRRAYTSYKLAEQFARTSYDHADRVRAAADAAVGNRADLAVRFAPRKVEGYPIEFIDILAAKPVTLKVDARLAPERTVTLSRPRPRAYYLAPEEKRAAETLRLFGVTVEELQAPLSATLGTYTIDKVVRDYEPMGATVPVTVTSTLTDKSMTLPAGSYRVPMDQPLAALIGTLMEPESANGFVNYGVIKACQGEDLKIYREK